MKGTFVLFITLVGGIHYFCAALPAKKKFEIISKKLTWNDALFYCKQRRKDLAAIRSEQDRAELFAALKRKGQEKVDGIWIGATDIFSPGDFYWVSDGQPVEFTDWHKGEPGLRAPIRHCVAYWYWHQDGGNTKWDDLECNDKELIFACESIEPCHENCENALRMPTASSNNHPPTIAVEQSNQPSKIHYRIDN